MPVQRQSRHYRNIHTIHKWSRPFRNPLRVENLCNECDVRSPLFTFLLIQTAIKPTLSASKNLRLLTYHCIIRPGASKVCVQVRWREGFFGGELLGGWGRRGGALSTTPILGGWGHRQPDSWSPAGKVQQSHYTLTQRRLQNTDLNMGAGAARTQIGWCFTAMSCTTSLVFNDDESW